MTSEPTKGPYRVEDTGNGTTTIWGKTPTGEVMIARVPNHVPQIEKQANARLFAGAWEMREFVARLAVTPLDALPTVLADARALLARIDRTDYTACGQCGAHWLHGPEGCPPTAPTLWGSYAGSAQGSEITLHSTEWEALQACCEALSISIDNDMDAEDLRNALEEHCSHGADDFEVQEVHLP